MILMMIFFQNLDINNTNNHHMLDKPTIHSMFKDNLSLIQILLVNNQADHIIQIDLIIKIH